MMSRPCGWLGKAAGIALSICAIGAVAEAKGNGDFLGDARGNALRMVEEGKRIFRFDTFGDEGFWNSLGLNQVVSTLSPRQALELGLKVDSHALPEEVVEAIREGKVNLDDPAVTLLLLRANAVMGVIGTFDSNGTLSAVGLTCALCHSVADDSVIPSVGERIDGLANRDLNVGGILAALPNLAPVVELLQLADPTIDEETVRMVLSSWGPGKFDAELLLDGRAFQPDGRPAATLLPNARGLAGYNLHTWTGGWGTVSYWNAFVAVLELHGVGTFFDERLDNADQFPIAAAAGFGHTSVEPDADQVTSKLPALQFYQLAGSFEVT